MFFRMARSKTILCIAFAAAGAAARESQQPTLDPIFTAAPGQARQQTGPGHDLSIEFANTGTETLAIYFMGNETRMR